MNGESAWSRWRRFLNSDSTNSTLPVKRRNRVWAFESLEDRRVLSAMSPVNVAHTSPPQVPLPPMLKYYSRK